MKAAKLSVYEPNGSEWELKAHLDVLPRMRASDLLDLVRGLAEPGDLVEYESMLFEYRRGGLRVLTAKEKSLLSFDKQNQKEYKPEQE
jgi:hypothetical protein